uniref:choline-phosphate cytidylyltransferase n=1 Tax=Timema shepardi TaxID=629360 RepID=A0A7R9FWT0_TIMSH|nr:unnamed protein product [Timema shepardi]
MMICDPDLHILNGNPRWGGARYDAFIWSSSPAHRVMEMCHHRGVRQMCLLGNDSRSKQSNDSVKEKIRNPSAEIIRSSNRMQVRSKAYSLHHHCKPNIDISKDAVPIDIGTFQPVCNEYSCCSVFLSALAVLIQTSIPTIGLENSIPASIPLFASPLGQESLKTVWKSTHTAPKNMSRKRPRGELNGVNVSIPEPVNPPFQMVRNEPAFAWRESGKPFRTNRLHVHPTEIRTSISPSSAVELNMTSALANYATEAVYNVCMCLSDEGGKGRQMLCFLSPLVYFSHQVKSIRKPAPYSDELDAELERERSDYTIRITYKMAKSGKVSRPIRVYADGIYDLFHQGHARQLMQAKNVFPNVYLLVGVCSDELTHSKKGRTVMTDFERYEAVRNCRYVDEVVREAPWELDDDFLNKHKIDFVAHDEIPYGTDDCQDVYAGLKAKGMFVATERTEGVSTSDIVARIVRDYDIYVRRNLARGYSAKELNVSFLNEKKFRLQNKMVELKDKGKRVMENIGEKKVDMIQKWEEKSRDFIDAFLLLFGREGRLSHIWNESKGRLMQALSPPSSPGRDGSPTSSTSYDRDEAESPPPKTGRYDFSPIPANNLRDNNILNNDYSDDDDNDEDDERQSK